MKQRSPFPYQCPAEEKEMWVDIKKQAENYFHLNNLETKDDELRGNGHHFKILNPKTGFINCYLATTTELGRWQYIGTKRQTWERKRVMKIKSKRKSRLIELKAAIK